MDKQLLERRTKMPRQHLKGIPLKRARSDVTKSMVEKEEKRVQQIEVTVK